MTNPDKYYKKAVYNLTSNIVVSGKIMPCFDSRMSGNGCDELYFNDSN
jgi:hypothetical protein